MKLYTAIDIAPETLYVNSGNTILLKELSEKKTGLQYFESLVKYVFSNVDDITVDKMQTIVDMALLED